MYTFNIKDNTPDINMVVTRCLLGMAAIASLLYRNASNFAINIIAAILLLIAAFFVNKLMVKYKVNTIVILSLAAIIFFIATHSIAFALMLVLSSIIIKKLYKQPVINVNSHGIIINKTLSNTTHLWSEFNNIILKDDLLTLDFKDNKLLQLNIEADETLTDESSFNNFCSRFIGI